MGVTGRAEVVCGGQLAPAGIESALRLCTRPLFVMPAVLRRGLLPCGGRIVTRPERCPADRHPADGARARCTRCSTATSRWTAARPRSAGVMPHRRWRIDGCLGRSPRSLQLRGPV